MKTAILFIGLALLAPGSASSLSLIDTEVSELYERSKLVVHATVTSVRGSCKSKYNCPGYRIKATISDVVKKDTAASKSTRVSMCSKIPLEIGHSYTVFLDDPNIDRIDMSNCGYVLGHAGAFEMRAGDWYRVNSPDSAVMFVLEGRTYYSNAVLAPNLVEELDRSVERVDSGS